MFERFRRLSARQQVVIVVATAVVVFLACVATWYLFLRVPYKALFTGLRANDAATIVAELDRKKVPYQLSDDGGTIYVPEDMAERTRLAVMTEDLPLKGTVGFELFDRSDMGLTDFAQKINYLRALQGELERTIASLDGIDSARVHLSLGEDRVFRDDTIPPKASVTIRMRQGSTLSSDAARGIQRLVAASVPNLDVANVVVLDAMGNIVNTATPQTTIAHSEDAQSEEVHAIEGYYASRLRIVLEKAYPLNTIVVKVTAQSPPAQGDGAAPDWSPQSRTFALKITILPVLALDGTASENIRTLAASAIGFDASKGDSLVCGVAPSADAGERGGGGNRVQWPHPLQSAGTSIPKVSEETIWAMALAAGAAVLFFFLVRGRRPRRLSQSQRAALAAQLRAALSKGGGNVA